MSLPQARANLREVLRVTDLEVLGDEIDKDFVQVIDDWFSAFKKELESRETFVGAFGDHRMTARVVKKEGGISDKLSMNKYNLTSKVSTPKHSTQDIYNTGMSGMKLRTNPGNFGAETADPGGLRKVDGKIRRVPPSKRGKYNLGLHDLSAVLLSTKRGNILNQLAWKEGAQDTGTNAVAFMPLPPEEDLAVFALLSEKAKKYRARHPAIYEKLVYVRHRMTRVKLANEEDAGSGFVNIGTGWTAKERKYRYGLGLIPIKGKQGAVGVAEMDRRQKLALEYRSMLAKMKPMPTDSTLNPTHNEMVIAYREHESKCFPLFTEFEKARNAWKVIDGPEGFDRNWIGSKVPTRIFQDGRVE